MTKNYFEFDELANIYLEDSYVLAIEEEPGKISFSVEAVLTEKHPKYQPPLPGEKYCYLPIKIAFISTDVQWLKRNTKQFIDASGEADLGNIDSLFLEKNRCIISGDWGKVSIGDAEIKVSY